MLDKPFITFPKKRFCQSIAKLFLCSLAQLHKVLEKDDAVLLYTQAKYFRLRDGMKERHSFFIDVNHP